MIPTYQLPTAAEAWRSLRSTFTTPEPQYVTPAPPQAAVAPAPDRRARIRAAAHRAPAQYPGPVGELVKRELANAEEFGQAFEPNGLTMRVVDQILGDRP